MKMDESPPVYPEESKTPPQYKECCDAPEMRDSSTQTKTQRKQKTHKVRVTSQLVTKVPKNYTLQNGGLRSGEGHYCYI